MQQYFVTQHLMPTDYSLLSIYQQIYFCSEFESVGKIVLGNSFLDLLSPERKNVVTVLSRQFFV